MHVKGHVRGLPDGAYHRHAEGYLRHEIPVHDVDMYAVGTCLYHIFNVTAQIPEIRCQYGRMKSVLHQNLLSLLSSSKISVYESYLSRVILPSSAASLMLQPGSWV